MTRAKISEYSATANDNTDVNGVDIAEGCPPSSMNNMGREIMAALKRFQVGSDGDGVTVGGALVVSGATTANTFTGTVVNATTIDTTNIEVTNIKAKDGTASATIADSTGKITVSGQMTIDGIEVGQGAGNVSTNTAVGASALAANTTGGGNTALGYQTLDANTTGVQNSAFGTSALGANTTGTQNTGLGRSALTANTTGAYNTAVGTDALIANTTASNNTAVGFQAGYSITTGEHNVCMGYLAGSQITTGSLNVSIGRLSMDLSVGITGQQNNGVGNGTLRNLTSGNYNQAFGSGALTFTTTGSNNIGIGQNALRENTTANNNIAVGYEAGYNITTGNDNVFIGRFCNTEATTGSNNIGVNSANGADRIFALTTESNRAIFGNNATTNAYVKVAFTVTSDARDKTSIESVPHGLSFVQQLNPVSYRWKTSRENETPIGNKRYGFLAQDILALEGDNPVIIDNEQPDNLKYQGEALVPVLVNAIKELSAQVTALQAEVNALKGQ